MAKVDGLPEIVGLRMDVRPMWVTEDELHLLDTMTHDEQRQWAIDNAPPGAASAAVITAERLRSLPLAEMRAAVAARLAGDDAFGAFAKVARERGKAWPDEHYRQVAEVYKSAVEHREPPLTAIQEHWHVSRPAAAKYVKGARRAGFPRLAGTCRNRRLRRDRKPVYEVAQANPGQMAAHARARRLLPVRHDRKSGKSQGHYRIQRVQTGHNAYR